ncbi:MAG: hypothetical protein KAG89_05815 [Fulvimarina manganoxydans]|uniref:hypothetical protein n=1 Tax=Fulvimarina manganoxydans TaxID=937218 RepID=UPI001483A751|nr:hypothetical protein [Fulvimarina manganoxydans]MCK5931670.1 hypothetical protein [Fulvimarina manganoxydans]
MLDKLALRKAKGFGFVGNQLANIWQNLWVKLKGSFARLATGLFPGAAVDKAPCLPHPVGPIKVFRRRWFWSSLEAREAGKPI